MSELQIILALMVVNLIGLLIIGLMHGSQARDTRRLDTRVTFLEAQVKNMPTHRDLLELRGDTAEMAESVAELNGRAETMTQMLRTIQEHLLEKDR